MSDKRSLILELQDMASESHCPLNDLLRKTIMACRKLELTDAAEWLSKELNGFGPKDLLPDYRIILGELKVVHPNYGPMPFYIPDPDITRAAQTIRVSESIGALQALLAGIERTNGVLTFKLPPKAENALLTIQDSFAPLPPVRIAGVHQIEDIFEIVRNRILDWTLDLEQKNVLGEGLTFSKEEKAKVHSGQTNITIKELKGGFQQITGDVVNSSVEQSSKVDIRPGEFASLAAFLRTLKIEESDIKNLERAITLDPEQPRTEEQFGKEVSAWFGYIVGKATQGAYDLSVGIISGLIANAIGQFYKG